MVTAENMYLAHLGANLFADSTLSRLLLYFILWSSLFPWLRMNESKVLACFSNGHGMVYVGDQMD